jgi:hypothetical protein
MQLTATETMNARHQVHRNLYLARIDRRLCDYAGGDVITGDDLKRVRQEVWDQTSTEVAAYRDIDILDHLTKRQIDKLLHYRRWLEAAFYP